MYPILVRYAFITILENDVLLSILRTCAILSDHGDFRTEFRVKGLPKALMLFESHSCSQTLCIRIFKAYIDNANKEGSGNANLKILQDKKLDHLVELVQSSNMKTSSIAADLIHAFAPHGKQHMSYSQL